jgi:PST family polysaccharide transporter
MTPQPLGRRLLGFLAIPALAAASPLIVLPFVSRTAGPAGWASAIAGESVGTLAAIAIGYGWASIGPAMISVAGDDARRARIYRDSIAIRLLLAVIVLPLLAVGCWFVASPGFEWLSVLMGMQGALIALSFTWYCAGVGDPRTIIVFDALPRLLATVCAAAAITATGVVELYPLAGILVTLVGTGLFTWRLLHRNPGPWPKTREVPGMLRRGAPVALNDAALSAYSSVPAPLVNVTSPPISAAGFASAEKMLKLGQFLPMTLANAFQSWVAETDGTGRRRRILLALAVLSTGGLAGWAGLAILGPWASTVLFGEEAASSLGILFTMGLVFAFFSFRTGMTRLVLFPAGLATTVMRATLVATALGTPLMIGLGLAWGPIGAAIGYAVTEGAAAVLLVPRGLQVLRGLAQTG